MKTNKMKAAKTMWTVVELDEGTVYAVRIFDEFQQASDFHDLMVKHHLPNHTISIEVAFYHE